MFMTNPTFYVGTCENMAGEYWTVNEEGSLEIAYSSWNSILLKMFDELLMNCLDNYVNSNRSGNEKMTYIHCFFSPDTKNISISNNGKAISLKTTKTVEGKSIHNPQLIFTRFFTSTHYNKTKADENVAGMNGVGAKIASAYSQRLYLTIVNKGTRYYQEFWPTATEICSTKPEITKLNRKEEHENITQITFIPDFERIDCDDALYSDTLNVFKKRLIDVKLMFPELSIVLNGNEFVPNLSRNNIFDLFDKDVFAKFKYGVISTNSSFKQFSIINGISVRDGGSHIETIINEILLYCEKKMRIKITRDTIKRNLLIIFIAQCPKPVFTDQAKTKLDKGFPKSILDEKELRNIYTKLKLNDVILDRTRSKSTAKNSSKARLLQIDGLTDAVFAGTSKSDECVLFLTEGLSASGFAKIGMKSVLDENYYGCYPVGGKILNVRKCTSIKKAQDSKTLKNIEKILGLKAGTSNDKLRYGKVVILKDADTDGAEIMGLIINFFHYNYPELLQRKFLYEFITPMIKLYVPKSKATFEFPHKNNVILRGNTYIVPFYNEQEFKHFKYLHPAIEKFATKYTKGLAGNEEYEARHYFTHHDENEIELVADDKLDETIDVVYGKLVQKRKEWMKDTSEGFLDRIKAINISDFLNTDVRMFSFANCERTIPSVVDGFKPSQRKVLWTLINSSKKYDVQKVFVLGGQVSSFAYYNHGDASICECIIKMGQTYPGSNNFNIVSPSGHFGSREKLGDDHGAPRYVGCSLNKNVFKIFPEIDTKLLPKNYEDNVQIEPKFFVPIIPMVLCNGSLGIGTGYSTFIPMYAKDDLKKMTIEYIKTGKFIDIHPSVNGFQGSIEKIPGGYEIKGAWRLLNRASGYDEYEISEIPYRISFEAFRDKVNKLTNEGKILSFYKLASSTGEKIKGKSKGRSSKVSGVNKERYCLRVPKNSPPLYKLLPLIDKISCRNFTLFDASGKLYKYDSIEEIFTDWFVERYDLYEQRKEWQLNDLNSKLTILKNKQRFINEIAPIIKEIKNDDDVVSLLEKREFAKIDNNYNYLLHIPIRQLTKENADKLQSDIDGLLSEISNLTKKSIEEIWISELENC